MVGKLDGKVGKVGDRYDFIRLTPGAERHALIARAVVQLDAAHRAVKQRRLGVSVANLKIEPHAERGIFVDFPGRTAEFALKAQRGRQLFDGNADLLVSLSFGDHAEPRNEGAAVEVGVGAGLARWVVAIHADDLGERKRFFRDVAGAVVEQKRQCGHARQLARELPSRERHVALRVGSRELLALAVEVAVVLGVDAIRLHRAARERRRG